MFWGEKGGRGASQTGLSCLATFKMYLESGFLFDGVYYVGLFLTNK